MGNHLSPLESLAAFAIVFVAGVVATTALGTYIARIKKTEAK